MMMKRNIANTLRFSTLVLATFVAMVNLASQSTAFAQESKSAGVALESEAAKLGYLFGFQVASGMRQDGIVDEVELEAFFAAQRDVLEDKELRMTEEEMAVTYQAFMTRKQEEAAAAAQVEKAKGDAYLAENKTKKGVKVSDTGLQYQILRKGKGKQPLKENTVLVHYEGKLINGEVFDSSYTRNEPTEFPVERVIPGFSEGLMMMKEGAKYRFVIPSEIAYGERRDAPGGPNQTLIFNVELIEVK